MENDLKIRGYSPKTLKLYLDRMRDFARFHHTSPDQLGPQHIHQYQVYLVNQKKVSWSYFNQSVCALRFFYTITLNRNWDIKHIPFQKKAKTLPTVLSKEQTLTLFDAIDNIKHRALILTLYSAGLRLQEALNLTPTDIDSKRMVIRVNQGKGKKDRYVMLSPKLLDALRVYWKLYYPKPKLYLFPGKDPSKPLNPRTVQRIVQEAKEKAGIKKKVSPQTLRHCFATHLLEDGHNIRKIQLLLGHACLSTTAIYTHVAKIYIHNTPSPLDTLLNPQKTKKED